MKIFFDTIILIFLVSAALPAIILLYHRQKDAAGGTGGKRSWEGRHKNWSLALAVIFLLGFAAVFYGSFIEPRLLIVKNEEIDLDGIDKPLRVAVMADLQVGPYKKDDYTAKVVDKILAAKPDLVFLVGDYVNNWDYNFAELDYLKPLEKLARLVPTYAVHGNHEYGASGGRSYYDSRYRLSDMSAQTKAAMEKMGIKYLVNELAVVQNKGQEFYLFGGDDYWSGKLDWKNLKKRDKNIPTIVLIHNPITAPTVAKYNVDLMLAGHTHGGQVRLPFIGALFRAEKFIPRAWDKGWVNVEKMKMFVTSGAGETAVRARFFNLPEVVALTIK